MMPRALITALVFSSFVYGQQPSVPPPPAPSSPALEPAAVAAFLDGYFAAYLEDAHVAGATVAVIENESVIFAKGYGFSDVSARAPVDPDETLFRIGSVSKLFVWTSVMQLVEQGKLDLDADVNRYLKDLQVPEAFGAPVTLADLMTHSAGFDERVLNLFGRDASSLRPLGDILADELPARVRPPGDIVSYSNHGTALAMYVVEQVTGVAWEDYIEKNILEPLELDSTSFAQPLPDGLARRLSHGYRFQKGELVERPFEYVPLASIGAACSSAHDLARFMAAHLGLGSAFGARILSEATARRMQTTLFRPAPSVNGMAHGFMELDRNGVRIIGHGGDTELFHTLFAFFPEYGIGIAASFNTAGADYLELLSAFVDWRFPVDASRLAPPIGKPALGRFTGQYRSTRFAHRSIAKLAALMSPVNVETDGEALLIGREEKRRFVPIEPLVFREEGKAETIAFREAADGTITNLFFSEIPVIGFERVPPIESPRFVTTVLGGGYFLLALAVLFWPFASWVRRHYGVKLPRERRVAALARWPAFLGAVVLICFGLGLAGVLSDPFNVAAGLPPSTRVLFRLPAIALLLFVIAWLGVLLSWRRSQGTFPGRVGITLLCLSAVGVLWQLYVWNFL